MVLCRGWARAPYEKEKGASQKGVDHQRVQQNEQKIAYYGNQSCIIPDFLGISFSERLPLPELD